MHIRDFFNGKLSRFELLLRFLIATFFANLMIVILTWEIRPFKNNLPAQATLYQLIYTLFFIYMFSLVVRRLNDLGLKLYWSALLLIPGVNLIFFLYLLLGNKSQDK